MPIVLGWLVGGWVGVLGKSALLGCCRAHHPGVMSADWGHDLGPHEPMATGVKLADAARWQAGECFTRASPWCAVSRRCCHGRSGVQRGVREHNATAARQPSRHPPRRTALEGVVCLDKELSSMCCQARGVVVGTRKQSAALVLWQADWAARTSCWLHGYQCMKGSVGKECIVDAATVFAV